MELGIVIPLVVLPILVAAVFVWYRRSMTRLRLGEPKTVSGARLTAEALHRLASPPWRVVYEIGGALGGVDHVVIGPPGIIAVTTVMADRPAPERLLETTGAAQLTSDAAIARGPVDELARVRIDVCGLSARVFWGRPDGTRPPADEVAHGAQLVEGQRLEDWLQTLEPSDGGPLDPARVDLAWQAISMGIGRPDPLH